MKKCLIIILFIVGALPATAGPEQWFEEGNAAYDSANYELALDYYQSILDAGKESSELYLNMGNAAFRANHLGYSILYFEKALKLDPGFEKAQNNLEYVSRFKEDKIEVVPELFIRRWVRTFRHQFSMEHWAIASVALFALTLAGLLFYLFGRRMALRKSGFFGGIVFLFLFLLAFPATLRRHGETLNPERGVIVQPSVTVRSTPNESGSDLYILHEGTTLRFRDKHKDYVEIQIASGDIGWIPMDACEAI